MILTRKQTIALDVLEDKEHTQILFGGGAGGGKSALGCYFLLKMCLKYPNTRWLMCRATLKSIKETTLKTFFEICSLQDIGINEYRYNQGSGTITFYRTGSEILLKDIGYNPSDSEYQRLGSLEITGAFIDEAAEVSEKAAMIVTSRCRYKLDEYGLLPKVLMTCNPSKNWIYSSYYKPHKNGSLEHYKSFIQSLVTDNPHISQHYIDALERLDKVSRLRLLAGDWEYEDDDDKLFNYDKLNDLFTNSYVQDGEKFISADIARFGKDKTVVCLWSGYRVTAIKVMLKNTLKEAADLILQMCAEHRIPRSNVIIDEDGIGGGVVDMIRGCKGFHNGGRPANKENYANLKTQCVYKLADLINAGKVYIQEGKWRDEIIEEFEVIKRAKIEDDITKLAISKKEIQKLSLGRSPDFADAIMMRLWFDLFQAKVVLFK
tara:strand:- start:1735 stop:3033 length:1299 start_codon:yes stop_codon:yes gene_type:complete